jgi:hypothetical protein
VITTTKLKGCPFCGRTGISCKETYTSESNYRIKGYIAKCSCGASITKDTPFGVQEAWNKRVVDAEEGRYRAGLLDDEIRWAFDRYHFAFVSVSTQRKWLAKCLLRRVSGKEISGAVVAVCEDLGLLTQSDSSLTMAGKEFLHESLIDYCNKESENERIN